MKALLDTSVLVAAIIEAHPEHARCFRWLQSAVNGDFEFVICQHTVAELYAVLTSLPLSPRIGADTARRMLRDNVLSHATLIELDGRDYEAVVGEMAELGVGGGAVYDGLIAHAAKKIRADRLLTLNVKHFRRVLPNAPPMIQLP